MSEERRTTFEDVETEKLIQKLTDNYTAPEMLAQIEEELRRRGELPVGYLTGAEQRRTAVVSEMRPRVEVDVDAAHAYARGAIGEGPNWSREREREENVSEKLKVGDVVQLKSGGPVMTVDVFVDGLYAKKALCLWFEGLTLKSAPFAPQTLVCGECEEKEDAEEAHHVFPAANVEILDENGVLHVLGKGGHYKITPVTRQEAPDKEPQEKDEVSAENYPTIPECVRGVPGKPTATQVSLREENERHEKFVQGVSELLAASAFEVRPRCSREFLLDWVGNVQDAARKVREAQEVDK